MKTPGIIFIHGAGLGSFIWEEVKTHLSNPVLALDFPNRGNTTNANSALSLADYAHDAIKKIEAWEQDSFIIVAHSIGGCVGLKIAKHFNTKLVGFMGVSAAIPANGGSFVSVFPFVKKMVLSLMINLAGTKPPDKAIAHDLCNGLTKEQTTKIIENFTPESKALYLDKCYARVPKTNCAYIKCTDDHGFPGSTQNKMAKRLNAENIISMKSGHLPMMSHPQEFTQHIQNFIQILSQ